MRIRSHTLSISLIALFFCTSVWAKPAPSPANGEPVPLKNPGFEDAYRVLGTPAATQKGKVTGQLAEGWDDNSDWADLAVEYAADATNPHEGKSSQRVAISRVTSGAVQFKQTVKFNAGHLYSLHLWLRGEAGAAVTLLLRKTGEPYTTYAQIPVTLSADWSEHDLEGVVTDDADGVLMVLANKPMTFWVDGVRLDDMGATHGVLPVALKNRGFESPYHDLPPASKDKAAKIKGQLADGWGENSSWADVDIEYSLDKDHPHGGKASQHVAVTRVGSGAAQFIQEVQFEKGIYAWHVWLRGQPATTVSLVLRRSDPATYYATEVVTLAAEWREFTVSGTVTEQAPGFLMIIANAPTAYSVDDVRLENLTNAASSAPPKVGNLLNGGSFEAGVSFGWRVSSGGYMKNRFADRRPSLDNTTSTDGKQSLRIEIPDGDHTSISSPLVPFNFNRPHTISIDLKADRPNAPVEVGLDGAEKKTTFQVGTDWKRYSVTVTPPYRSFTRLDISCAVPAGEPVRTLWIDAAQVEESSTATAYQAPFPQELTLQLPRPGSVVFDGEKAEVQVGVAPGLPPGARLQLSVLDLYEKTRDLPPVPLPAKSFALPDFADRPRGMFKLHGQIVNKDGTPISAPVEMVWARLPKPRDIKAEDSFFGIHIPLTPSNIATARATGHRWARLHDSSMIAKWAIAEPVKGQFEFHDEGVTAAHDGGIAILGLLDGAPAWASAKPRATDGYWSVWNIPDGTENWKNYVRTVTEHYKGRIDYWELWNEPWGQWWTGAGGTPQGYADLLKVAYATSKEANPKSIILGIDGYRGNPWNEKALAASGTDHYDEFSFHDYSDSLYGGPDSQSMQDARTYNAAQAKYGTAKRLWITEGGPGAFGSFYIPEAGGLEPRRQLAQAVRFDVTSMAAGVKAFFLYAVHADPPMGPGSYNAIEHDRAIRPVLAARAVLASLVDGARCLGRTEPTKGVDAYDFTQTDGQKITVLWSYDGAAHAVPLPAKAKALDVQGNPIAGNSVQVDTEPVYFLR